MGRTRKFARKSTGGKAPRRGHVNVNKHRSAMKQNNRAGRYILYDADGKMMWYGGCKPPAPVTMEEIKSSEPEGFQLALDTTEQRRALDVTKMAAFDLFDEDNIKAFNHRTPAPLAGRLADTVDPLPLLKLHLACEHAKKKYRESSYVLLWKTAGKGVQKTEVYAEEDIDSVPLDFLTKTSLRRLPKMLERSNHGGSGGQHLNGCVLKGDKTTGRFGLVSTRRLAKGTLVAVGGGILWSSKKHSEWVKSTGDSPLVHLKSTEIPYDLLNPFVRFQKRGMQNFVLCTSVIGNETSEIDDPSWLYAESGAEAPRPTLDSVAILDLENKVITIGYYTTSLVAQDTELIMDWGTGCWIRTSTLLLARYAMVSNALLKDLRVLEEQAKTRKIDLRAVDDSEEKDHEEDDHEEDDYEDSEEDEENKLINSVYHKVQEKDPSFYGPRYKILNCIHEGSELPTLPREGSWYTDCPQPDLDAEITLVAVTKVNGVHTLSDKVRECLQNIPDEEDTVRYGDSRVQELVDRVTTPSVRKVEITDALNPAFLFNIPGSKQKAYGLIAEKAFEPREPVICYGGKVVEYNESSPDHGSYWFDVHLDAVTAKGFQLGIDGSDSLAGFVNDAWAPRGLPQRKPNCVAETHWDREKKVPQIILVATRPIKKGEELLYHYGEQYWKVMLNNIILAHGEFASETLQKCKHVRSLLKPLEVSGEKSGEMSGEESDS